MSDAGLRVSVLIPSYNHGPYLRSCIESVLCQKVRPFEVVVVDDGSTDESREVIHGFGDRITPRYQSNKGTYATLNVAASMATGDWLAIQNSDDLWLGEKLQRQMDLVRRHPQVGLVHTGCDCVDSEGAIIVPHPSEVPDYHGDEVSDLLPDMLHSNPIVISSVLVSRAAWQSCGPFDERYHGAGDWDFCLNVASQFPIGFVDQRLTRVRRHSSNSSTDATRIPAEWPRLDWLILGREKLPPKARELYRRANRGLVPRSEAVLALSALSTLYATTRDTKLARSTALMALRLQPTRIRTVARLATTLLPRFIRRRLR